MILSLVVFLGSALGEQHADSKPKDDTKDTEN